MNGCRFFAARESIDEIAKRALPFPDHAVVAAEPPEQRLRLQRISGPTENDGRVRQRTDQRDELAVFGEKALRAVIRIGVQVAKANADDFGMKVGDDAIERGARLVFETEVE